jgi:hypothetical protein
MSEHDPNHDPIDKAYAEAEALLNDEASRAARRAKLLATVATDAAPVVGNPRRSPWPRAVWLAAAGIGGMALILASQSRLTDRFRLQTPPPRVQSPTPAPFAAMPLPEQPPAVAPRRTPPAPVTEPAPQPPGPPSAVITAAPKAFPESSAPAPGPPPATISLNLRNLGSGRTALRPNLSPPPVQQREVPPPPESAPPEPAPPPPPPPPIVIKPSEKVIAPPPPPRPAPPAAAPSTRAAASEGADHSPDDLAARLRTAATAGRTTEVDALLAQGALIDMPDEAGDTALMKSIQANHPEVAAALRRRGASLEVKNRAGQSVRDMAAVIGDAKLNQALGLAPPSAAPPP